MLYDGIGFNLKWMKEHSEDEFVQQHINAFDNSDHPIKKKTPEERESYLRTAYQFYNGKPETNPVKDEQAMVSSKKKGKAGL